MISSDSAISRGWNHSAAAFRGRAFARWAAGIEAKLSGWLIARGQYAGRKSCFPHSLRWVQGRRSTEKPWRFSHPILGPAVVRCVFVLRPSPVLRRVWESVSMHMKVTLWPQHRSSEHQVAWWGLKLDLACVRSCRFQQGMPWAQLSFNDWVSNTVVFNPPWNDDPTWLCWNTFWHRRI